MYDIAVIIINYRTPNMTIKCLESLIPEISQISSCVVVIDNASGDESNDIIGEWLINNNADSKVRFIHSLKNLGFSGGNNLGIRSIESKYYLLLNSDTLIKTGAVKKLINAATTHPNAGIVSPRLEDIDGTPQINCFKYIHPFSEFIASAQTGLITQLLKKYDVPLPVKNIIDSPEWTSFACVLIKYEVFDDVGLLDDEFFMYFEDTEFCFRARKSGWDIINNPESHIIHLQGASSKIEERTKYKKRLPRYYYEARTRYFYKLYGRVGVVSANTFWWLGRIVSLLRQLLGRKDKAVVKKKWRDNWINCVNPLKPYIPPINRK